MVHTFSVSLPFLIMVGVAPLTPHTPCDTMTITSFEVRGPSVASNRETFGSLVSASALSVGADKSILLTGIRVPHVRGFTPSTPNSPPHYATAAPTVHPTGRLLDMLSNRQDSLTFAIYATPAALTFF